MLEPVMKSLYIWLQRLALRCWTSGLCTDASGFVRHPSDRTARGCLMAFSPPSNWSFVALTLAFILARTLAQMLAVGPSWTHRLIQAYVYVFQGTPILIQLWLMYYGLAQFEWIRESDRLDATRQWMVGWPDCSDTEFGSLSNQYLDWRYPKPALRTIGRSAIAWLKPATYLPPDLVSTGIESLLARACQ